MTPVEHRILRGLAEYRYLTMAQMQTAKIGRDRKNLSERLSRLSKAGFIGVLKWGVYPTLGRLPWMHYLKAKGARVLAEYERREVTEIPYVRSSDPKSQMDHFHRRYTVDCHIALNHWTKATERDVSFFWPYYSKREGSVPRLRLPDGRNLLPDALFELIEPHGRPSYNALEICTDKGGKDRKRIGKQIDAHFEAIEHAVIGDLTKTTRNHRLLVIFEQRNSLEAIIKRFENRLEYEGREDFFLLNTVETVRDNFGEGWQDISGNPAILDIPEKK